MYPKLAGSVLAALILCSLIPSTEAQTYSSCNPLLQSGCPADPALGRSVDVDFTAGSSSEFTASGAVSYTSDGAAFTISQHGDAPTLSSNWYIMFGHVDYVVKAAPGTGIVSAAILQSDCLDEIDWEWLGGDNTQAQSNYFGKGITTTGYNRGAYHGAPNNHDEFHTYSIDWTADQIVWSIDGATVRAMTQEQAEAGQYPQTPMYVKLGAWAGGDPSNPEGTIQWAGGVTDYSKGPFTMYVKSVHVTDYSTGSQYTYSGTSGTWQSIVSTGGQINSEGDGTPASSGTAPAVTSSVPNSAPLAFGNSGDTSSVYATRTGWPWSGTATATAVSVSTSLSFSSSSSAALPLGSASASLEVVKSYNEQGFPTLVTINPAAPTAPKSYDSQGFSISELSTSCFFDLGPRTIRKPELRSFRSPELECYGIGSSWSCEYIVKHSAYLDPQFDIHIDIELCAHLSLRHGVNDSYFHRNGINNRIHI
ncbi:uncharacterized protein Z519_04806 [Cladophialophora bantiana CBS 173.52]|uniref:chitinase n=1 Tax=Cladophialophora bantiana (strain ATCC 10958 / CBS 173.52 / CDC B-1940 / NIH 8579) TaxID=1442370 RepID=A0A0D2HN58_CLAB1|nr:uncharacterized protein Z519_04806 [Cladophialophora bantiana CBS 173.52]KIW94828.1 hypothetical protein Z519_04806 [Cladophialophora bantiana CBS 173.52]